MKVLLTAFNGKNNSSKVLLDMIKHDNKLYLKNSFTSSVNQLEKELKSNEYDLIISFGQAPLDNDTLKIETVGKNIVKYRTQYDYIFLKKKLEDKDFNVFISEDAGNYLCNNIYYNGLKYIKEHNLSADMIFIHIPKISYISDMEKLADIFNNKN